MKKIIFLLTAVLMAMSMQAAPVDQMTASMKAQRFLTNEYNQGKFMSPTAVVPVLLKAETGEGKVSNPVYYIFNTLTNFIVVAGDDRAEEILMVGDRPLPSVNDIPAGMQDLLGQYRDQIMFLQKNPNLRPNNELRPAKHSLNAEIYGPLLTCNWDQEAPYYNQCKFGTYQCLTGCPATSASMVFYFWKYPTAATPVVPGYTSTIDYSYYGSKKYTHTALPSTTFDWANMKDSYSSGYTTAQGTAVATLMHYVGQAERMGYGTSSAGGSGVSVDSVCNIRDAFVFFGYDANSTRFVKKTSAYSGGRTLYTDAEWAAMIQEEMIAGRPIVFCAVSTNGGGHAFNVDGYNAGTNRYHVNFGWSGTGNAWCALNSFGYSSYNFSVYQQMVIGIKPPTTTATPKLTVNPTSLSMTANTGATVTKTFTVTGTNLNGNVNLTMSGANVFSITPTTITAANAANGVNVTVTYAPTAAGTQNATITVASSGAESKTVALTGTATTVVEKATPVLGSATGIGTNAFTANWTHNVPSSSVSSYTLYVNLKSRPVTPDDPDDPTPAVTPIAKVDGSKYTGSYKTISLSSPWAGTGVYGGNGAVYFATAKKKAGQITYTIPKSYKNATFTVRITTANTSRGAGNITVASSSTAAVGHTFAAGETYTWTVKGTGGKKITITSSASQSPDMVLIEIYEGTPSLNATRTGNEEAIVISGINPGVTSYTVDNLIAGATYTYYVVAKYVDGTTATTATKEVTLAAAKAKAVTPNNGIASELVGDVVESVIYVNLSGQQSSEPWNGVNIVVTRYRNGAVTSTKRKF